MSKNGIFPPQKLPLSRKTKSWKEDTLEAIISRYHVDSARRKRLTVAYNAVDSEFDLGELKYVTDPYKVGEGFPARIQNINIIRPKIELLQGEETKRPDSFVVFRTDDDATETMIEKQKELLYRAIEESLTSENVTNDQEQMQFLQQRLQEIKNYISNEYYDPAEQVALKTLKYLKEKLDLKDEFLNGFGDGLRAGEEIYYTGIINGNPVLERIDPRECAWDQDSNIKFIDEGDWFVRHTWMTPSSVYDRFYDLMTESDLNYMLDSISNGGKSSYNATNAIKFNEITSDTIDGYHKIENGYAYNSNNPLVSVFHCTWKSYKKIGYLTYTNPETGETFEDIVDETYKIQESETIVWDWIIEWWEGYKVGQDLYIGIKPIEYQDVSIDNPNAQRGIYTGGIYSYSLNSTRKSLVDIMLPLQYFYMIIFYRMELTIARDKGKVLLMDITQIPKGLGIDESKWMHYLTAMGVAFVNPYDEGWNIPGREGGKASAYNQLTAVDLSMANVLAEYINLMEKIEAMIGEISGISRARQGQIHQRELVGNVEREVTQSSHITEPLFWRHNQIKRRALTNLLNVAKFAFKTYDKKYLNYIFKGTERTFIEITEDFPYHDYDVFLTDSTKEYKDLQLLQNLYQPAMQNGASLLDVASIMTEDNMSEIKRKLSDIEKSRAEMIRQSQEMEQQNIAQELELKKEDLRIKEEDSIRKAETSLNIALLGRNESSENEPEDSSNIELELEKLSLQKEKIQKDYNLKDRQLNETERHNKVTESISRTSKKNITKK